ncbi:MAG: Glutathione-binding protein GsiB [Chroococcopsis gigantea SAG 12.99]|jgi:peptide/nickel transport system substrate-binding protein|nr:peptide ABC transporter substrate-binding protein [Chlorogloea purpurea SAG 13.99]MDV3001235.1 Glutathione-binding protein GsiB [Chroococcopsis gigantea SAG 12.99]
MQALKRVKAYFLICVISLILVVGCQSQKGDISRSPSGDRITIGTTLKPRTLDPADSYELAGLFLIYNLGETLYTYAEGSTTLKPLLASALPTVSGDGLVYTIPVRQGVKFQNGTAFDAAAMAFSLNRFIKNGGEPSFLLADTIDRVEATGPYELTITLKKPFAAFPSLLAYPGACAVSPAAYEIGKDTFKPDQFIGTGPYKLTKVTPDAYGLERFEDYWGEKAKTRHIDIQIYQSNPANLFNAFRTGAVDIAYQSLQAPQVKKLQKEAREGQFKLIEGEGSAVNFMSLNFNSEPVKNPLVRQAIAALVDRDLLNERILQGQGTPLYSLIPTGFSESEPVFKNRYGSRNVKKAKALLTEAGYTPENPAVVEIWHSSGSITASTVAAVMKALAKRDLDGLLTFEPNSILTAAFFKNVSRGLYSSALSNWYPDFLDADNYIYPFLSCAKGSDSKGCEEGGAQSQGSFYYSDRLNGLIDRERREQNPSKRKEIFTEIQNILAENVPYIPLWQAKDYVFTQNHIEGVKINPGQTIPFWKISPAAAS